MNQHNNDKQHTQRQMQRYTSTCKGQTNETTQQKHEHSCAGTERCKTSTETHARQHRRHVSSSTNAKTITWRFTKTCSQLSRQAKKLRRFTIRMPRLLRSLRGRVAPNRPAQSSRSLQCFHRCPRRSRPRVSSDHGRTSW